MKNSDGIVLIVLAIICYIIVSVGAIIAILGICVVLVLLIIWLVKTIMSYVRKTKNKKLFYDKLSSTYHISVNSQSTKINRNLFLLINEMLSKYHLSNELQSEFECLRHSMNESLLNATVWINNVSLTETTYKSKALSRYHLKYYKTGFLDNKNYSCPSFFSLNSKVTKFHFFPCFILTEIENDYNLVKYNDISYSDRKTISVEEASENKIKGASPAYYNYLHERVDGGPDRRYKHNPSTPVYLYDAFRLNAGKEVQFIFASHASFSKFVSSIEKYQQMLVKHPLELCINVKDIDLRNNEYASLIRDLIAEHGKYFVLSKSFPDYLRDYRLPNQYPYFLPILEKLNKSMSLERIIQEDCRYEDLDKIKNSMKQSMSYTEMELATVLAFLGHGLQVKA